MPLPDGTFCLRPEFARGPMLDRPRGLVIEHHLVGAPERDRTPCAEDEGDEPSASPEHRARRDRETPGQRSRKERDDADRGPGRRAPPMSRRNE